MQLNSFMLPEYFRVVVESDAAFSLRVNTAKAGFEPTDRQSFPSSTDIDRIVHEGFVDGDSTTTTFPSPTTNTASACGALVAGRHPVGGSVLSMELLAAPDVAAVTLDVVRTFGSIINSTAGVTHESLAAATSAVVADVNGDLIDDIVLSSFDATDGTNYLGVCVSVSFSYSQCHVGLAGLIRNCNESFDALDFHSDCAKNMLAFQCVETLGRCSTLLGFVRVVYFENAVQDIHNIVYLYNRLHLAMLRRRVRSTKHRRSTRWIAAGSADLPFEISPCLSSRTMLLLCTLIIPGTTLFIVF